MNARAPTRPEDRCRRELESPAWADTVPAFFRSEAFAEDLHEVPAPTPPPPRQRAPGWREQTAAVAAQSAR